MNKKDIKVKKSNGSNISITIENNLNANNKQINHEPKRRRRRTKKPDELQPTDIQPTDIQPSIPLKDTSYIKPPVGAFKIWRNTMDSYNTTTPMDIPMNQAQQLGLVAPEPQLALPAPPAQLALPAPPPQLALPAPPAGPPLTMENFMRAMMGGNQQKPPNSWGRELIDDEYNGPIITEIEDDIDFANELNKSVAAVYGLDSNDPESKEVTKEVKEIVNKARVAIQAKRLGTLHGNKKWTPRGQFKDTEAYKAAYNASFNKVPLIPEPIVGRTRSQTSEPVNIKTGQTPPALGDAGKLLFSKTELDDIKAQSQTLNEQLRKAGLINEGEDVEAGAAITPKPKSKSKKKK